MKTFSLQLTKEEALDLYTHLVDFGDQAANNHITDAVASIAQKLRGYLLLGNVGEATAGSGVSQPSDGKLQKSP